MKRWLLEHRFAIVETGARVRRQPWSMLLNAVVVSIALALPLLGYTLLIDLQPVTGQLASDPEITVFMTMDAKRSESMAIAASLAELPGVSQTQFVAREDALDALKRRPGMGSLLATLPQNPLPDAWVVRLKTGVAADQQSSVSAQQLLADRIAALPKVDHVQLDAAWLLRMEALMRFLRLALLLVAVALAAAVVTVIFNTIRLQVLTHRDEIEVSQLIGATNRFIRRPFYYAGALQGCAGGLIALAAVALALIPLNDAAGQFARLYSSAFRFGLPPGADLALFIVIAALLGWLGALLSVSRHLGMRRRR